MLYRGMTPAQDGLPLVGRSKRQLGVVVPGGNSLEPDIAPDPAGVVHPRTGGMSVASSTMWDLPKHRRPRGMDKVSTGYASDRVYVIALSDVEKQPLDIRPDTPIHSLVEPSRPVALAAYERALAATRPDWRQVWPP